MHILLRILQVVAVLLYGASGIMKVFLFDSITEGVASFGALPREAWAALGILELACVTALIAHAAFRARPMLAVIAAVVLAIESLVFIGVHATYGEVGSIMMSGVLGVLMACLAYGRMALRRTF